MEKYQPNMNHRFSSRTVPCDTSISHATNASLRHHHQLHLRPPTPTLNPYQECIDSLLSRLHVSDPSEQFLYPGFHHGIFLGSTQDRLLAGGQPFLVDEMGPNVRHNGASSYLPPRLLDYVSYSDMPPSNIDLWDNSLYGIPRFKNVNGLSLPDSRRFLNGFGNDLVSRTNDSARTSMYNRMPNYSSVEHLPLQYLRGKILSLAKDQSGCRLVQRTIENASKEEIDLVLSEVIEYVAELMIDPCGNYVVQKLVEVCTEEQRNRILVSVTKKEFQLVTICLNSHGTRAVQKLLQRITSPLEVSIVMTTLSPGAVALTKDMNGHHVIKHCLEQFSAEDNKCLLDVVIRNCFDIATDKSGCCVLQQCVERCNGETRDALVAEITACALPLAEHQFGNYVVQHILGLKVPQTTANLIRQLEGHFAALACNKYGSNVVEKCLYESKGEQSTEIVLELLRSPNFSMLLVDPYGNFVIQAALSVSKGAILRTFLEMIQANSPRMRNNIYGKKVLTWLHKKKVQYT